ncbi:MAG: ThuA domain-containing protein [Planctomycetales bacterium]
MKAFRALPLALLFLAGCLSSARAAEPARSSAAATGPVAAEMLRLPARCRVETAPGSGRHHALTKILEWKPAQTAIVVCDMWDDHYCQSSARRVREMAPRMNEVLHAARARGVFIIHCPSGTTDFYDGSPQRELAQRAPEFESKVPLEGWCKLDPEREGSLPIDDSNGGCDDDPIPPAVRKYNRQIDLLEIAEGDAVAAGYEPLRLMRQRGIENVIVMGVHTNICVLGRPFGIRQLVKQGKNVVLMRDLTDTMYDPRKAPFVSHFTGNDLVVGHVETHWCPTILSTAFVGGDEFRFEEDKRPHVAIVMAEEEYGTEQTLPKFALEQLGKDFRVSLVFANPQDRDDIPGLEVLDEVDLAIFAVRRRAPKESQMAHIRKFFADGKPLVALRTTSHAFHLKGKETPAGHAAWNEFDREILGGYYQNHHGGGKRVAVTVAAGAADHPILAGVDAARLADVGSLYRSAPLLKAATPLLIGAIDGAAPEPIAWTNRYGSLEGESAPADETRGRVFYASIGGVKNFEDPQFVRLLKNAVHWAAGNHE